MVENRYEMFEPLLISGKQRCKTSHVKPDRLKQHAQTQIDLLLVQRTATTNPFDPNHAEPPRANGPVPATHKIVIASLEGKSPSSHPLATPSPIAAPVPGISSQHMARMEADTRILCESCGYDLAGIPTAGTCGECGRPVAESLPDRRTGSPWQQNSGPVAWLGTAQLMLRQPRQAWNQIKPESARSNALLITNAAIGASLPTLAIIASPSTGLGSGLDRFSLSMLITWIAAWGGLWIALMVLTWIEARGIRFFGARSGWRVNRSVAAAVCGHASFGWVIAGTLLTALWLILERTDAIVPIATAWNWIINLLTGTTAPATTRQTTRTMELSYFTVLASGFVVGMMIFETLVYLGVRRLKFANRSEPQ